MKHLFERYPEAWCGLIVFGCLVALLPHWTDHLDPLTGDEPFYVMTAISIIEDLDVDESNNYEAVRVQTESGVTTLYRFDRALYPPDPLPDGWEGWESPPELVGPHAATTDRQGYFTKHGLGLSFLIAFPYAIAGRIGANLLVIAVASVLASQMYLLARDANIRKSIAILVTLVISLAMPLGPYSLLLFPEVPAALLLVYGVRRLAAKENSHVQWLIAGLSIGFLPWLHQRFAFTAAVLALIGITLLWNGRKRSDLLSFVSPILIGGFTLLGYNQWLYGIPIQRVEDHAGFSDLNGTVNGAFGLLLDAQWGLLVAAPVMVIALATSLYSFKHARTLWSIVFAACFPYVIVIAAYSVWWGEWGPPARYLVPIIPFAVIPLGLWLSERKLFRWSIFVICLAPGITLTLVGYFSPQRFYHHPDGHNRLVDTVDSTIGTNIASQLIAFQPLAASPVAERIWSGLLLIAILSFLTLSFFVSRRSQDPADDQIVTKLPYVR